MIAALKGLVESTGDDHVVIDVHGVGYLVLCSARTLSGLPRIGKNTALHIETVARENQLSLYGFRSDDERALFRLLTAVTGVGARVGLALLSLEEPSHIRRAIAAGDKAFLTRAQGVGPKLAARVISELKDQAAAALITPSVPAAHCGTPASVIEDAISALVNLGYGRLEALDVIENATQRSGGAAARAEALIAEALRDLGGRE